MSAGRAGSCWPPRQAHGAARPAGHAAASKSRGQASHRASQCAQLQLLQLHLQVSLPCRPDGGLGPWAACRRHAGGADSKPSTPRPGSQPGSARRAMEHMFHTGGWLGGWLAGWAAGRQGADAALALPAAFSCRALSSAPAQCACCCCPPPSCPGLAGATVATAAAATACSCIKLLQLKLIAAHACRDRHLPQREDADQGRAGGHGQPAEQCQGQVRRGGLLRPAVISTIAVVH
jgi:hypothetical protein